MLSEKLLVQEYLNFEQLRGRVRPPSFHIMVKVEFKDGKVKLVSNNEAHGLIESGKAILFRGVNKYENKALLPKIKRTYKTK